jgi:hypothetical protein
VRCSTLLKLRSLRPNGTKTAVSSFNSTEKIISVWAVSKSAKTWMALRPQTRCQADAATGSDIGAVCIISGQLSSGAALEATSDGPTRLARL